MTNAGSKLLLKKRFRHLRMKCRGFQSFGMDKAPIVGIVQEGFSVERHLLDLASSSVMKRILEQVFIV